MTRIALVSQWLLGHLVPILGIGAELAKRGHDLFAVGPPEYRALIESAGAKYVEASRGKYPHKFMADTLLEMDALLNAIDPDLVVCDSALSAPAYVAEKRGVPWVSYQTAVYCPDDRLPGPKAVNERLRTLYAAELDALRRDYGLPPLAERLRTRGDLAGLSSDLHLMLFMEELLPDAAELPPGSKITGPIFYEGAASGSGFGAHAGAPAAGGSRIVVCTSSGDKPGHDKLTARYVDGALKGLSGGGTDLRVLAHAPYAGEAPLPTGASWHTDYPNHHVHFPNADLILTHGGNGTLQQAVRYGVPAIVIPLGPEHDWGARRLEALGVARRVEAQDVSASSLSRAAEEVFRSEGMKARAQALSRKLNRLHAVGASADEIERRVRTRLDT